MEKSVLEASYELKIQALETNNKALQALVDVQKKLISQLKNQIGFYKISYDEQKSQLDKSMENTKKAMEQIKKRDDLIESLGKAISIAENACKAYDEAMQFNSKPENRIN